MRHFRHVLLVSSLLHCGELPGDLLSSRHGYIIRLLLKTDDLFNCSSYFIRMLEENATKEEFKSSLGPLFCPKALLSLLKQLIHDEAELK